MGVRLRLLLGGPNDVHPHLGGSVQERVAGECTEGRCPGCQLQLLSVGRRGPEGHRRNKSGDVPLYLCSTCGRRFAGREGFHNRRADPEKIALALDLYFRGMSVRKVAEHFREVHQLKISHVTVYRWVAHFGKIAAEWMDAQGARTSDRWHIDETVVGVDGVNKYLWNILDDETRFLLATHVSRGRNLKDARAPLHKAKAATPDRPVDVLTDGMQTYPEAVKKELGRRATPFDYP